METAPSFREENSVALKIAVGGNGHYHFKIYWATHVTTGETLVGGTCNATVSSSSCDAGLGFSVDLSASLYDNTNGTYVSGTGGACWQGGCNNQPSWIEQGYAYNDSSCSSGSCSYNNNSYTTGSPVGNHLTFFINTSWTLLTSHSYMLLMGADGSTYAYCDGFSTQLTGCAATAVVNAATLGNYEKLAFVGWR